MTRAPGMRKKDKQQTLVPRLRFPEFQDGDGWLTPELADLYRFKRTNTLSRDKLNYEDGTVKNIHYGDIHTKFQTRFYVSDEYVPYLNPDVPVDSFNDNAFCEEGDIVLADASEDLNDVGKAIEIVSLDGQQVVAGTHTILATRRGAEPIVGFGGYLFQSAVVRGGIHKQAQGAKVYGISANRISEIQVPLPPTPAEQQKIADYLGSLDDLIAAQRRKLAALRDHKKGLMQQLFPREGETRPRLRFPEFREAAEWTPRALSTVAREISDGDWIESKDQSPSGIRLVQTGNVGEGVFIDKGDNARFISEETFKRLRCKEVRPGDCLISRLPDPIGRACLVPDTRSRMITAVDCAIVRFRSDKIVPYLFIALSQRQEYYREVDSLASGSTRKRISRTKLAEVELYLPELREQQRIADCLSALDDLIAAQTEKLEALRIHKRGLMQQLFPSPEDISP